MPSRRSEIEMTDEEVRAFLDEQMVMQCATIGIENGVRYEELRGVMFECDVALDRDTTRIEQVGLRLFERYAGGLTAELREMVAKQARKRVGLRFVPTRTVTWDHRKLGGAY